MTRKIRDILLDPFGENLAILLVVTLLSSLADFVFWISYGDVVFAVYMALHGVIMAYAIVLLLGLLKGVLFRLCLVVVLCLGVVNLCIDVGVHTIMHFGFTSDLVAVFLGTNGTETREFLEMYVNGRMVMVVVLLLLFIGLIYWFVRNKLSAGCKFVKICGFLIVVAGAIVIFGRKSANWPGVFLMKIYTIVKYEPTPNLRDYCKTHSLNVATTPNEVVLIIGESLNKEFMSLYGYQRETTPRLDSLRKSSNLLVFDNIKSSGIGTVPAFKYMMTSLRQSDNANAWLASDFLLDILNDAGYHTMWISNQAESGVHDNVVARFAALADSTYFCGTRYMGPAKRDLDEVVLQPVKNRVEERLSQAKFTVIHLSGNHEKFSERYPERFAVFSSSDYLEYPEYQRKTRSEYDNSVLYNDFVVSNIIDYYKHSEAVIFYFPDHSLDIYHSDDRYAGHARPTVPVSVAAGTNIPFIVYMTDRYKERFPEIANRISRSINKNMETEDVMYSILDVAGVSFEKSDAVKAFSLFSL